MVRVALRPLGCLPQSAFIKVKNDKTKSDKTAGAGSGAGTFPAISPGSRGVKLLCAGQEGEQQTSTKRVVGRACTETSMFCLHCVSNA